VSAVPAGIEEASQSSILTPHQEDPVTANGNGALIAGGG
jgi:hypothetical protein